MNIPYTSDSHKTAENRLEVKKQQQKPILEIMAKRQNV